MSERGVYLVAFVIYVLVGGGVGVHGLSADVGQQVVGRFGAHARLRREQGQPALRQQP